MKLTFDSNRDCGEHHVTQDILVESCAEGLVLISQYDGTGEGPYCIAVAPKSFDLFMDALKNARHDGTDTHIDTDTLEVQTWHP